LPTGGDLRNKHMRSQRLEQRHLNLFFHQTKTAMGYIFILWVLPQLRLSAWWNINWRKSVTKSLSTRPTHTIVSNRRRITDNVKSYCSECSNVIKYLCTDIFAECCAIYRRTNGNKKKEFQIVKLQLRSQIEKMKLAARSFVILNGTCLYCSLFRSVRFSCFLIINSTGHSNKYRFLSLITRNTSCILWENQ